MLMPKKVKYRKQQRGRMTGKAWRGSTLSYGDFGLKVLEPGWITDRQIEASRVAMTRFVKRDGRRDPDRRDRGHAPGIAQAGPAHHAGEARRGTLEKPAISFQPSANKDGRCKAES